METLAEAITTGAGKIDGIGMDAQVLEVEREAQSATSTLPTLAAGLVGRKALLEQDDAVVTKRQCAGDKLTTREHIDPLPDEDSTRQLGAPHRRRVCGSGVENRRPPTDGVVVGRGTVWGQTGFFTCTSPVRRVKAS